MTEKPFAARLSQWASLALGVAILTGVAWVYWPTAERTPSQPTAGPDGQSVDRGPTKRKAGEAVPRFVSFGKVMFWWEGVPETLQRASLETGPQSNMHRLDYVGPEKCGQCHKKQYEQWRGHAHRRMNAIADENNVEGDFSDGQTIHYLGGEAAFYRKQGEYRMKLIRGEMQLEYQVRQTIGSRFFQYYIGRLVEGPFSDDHPYRRTNHVLPFGYWLDRRQWIPVVHVGSELPDGLRYDPFAPPPIARPGQDFIAYAPNCSVCHTTFPLADDLTRKPAEIARHAPAVMHWRMADYFREHHPELWGSIEDPADVPDDQIESFPKSLMNYEPIDHAVTLGISCEACHLGGKAHAENPKLPPDFHPHSPHLSLQTKTGELQTGRVHQNLNWACARCHVGDRPRFAAGMSTWNSVEYSDAMLGSCYSELKCVDCHSPHEGTGKQWSRTRQQDDASCLRCHTQFASQEALREHTHHDVQSSGSSCLNCHMPRINEGLQNVVRTHTIFSPTNAAMLEANHPNACNLCHTDQPIDWTLAHLKDWYGASFSEEKIADAYPHRAGPVAAGWMKSDYEPVRLVAAQAACRVQDKSVLPELIGVLDDPFLLNRQFSQVGIEEMLQIRLKDYGYRFYMSPEERREPLAEIRKALLESPEANRPDGQEAAP